MSFAVGVADDDAACEVEEKAGVDNARDVSDRVVELFGGGGGRVEGDIEDQIAVFSDVKGMVVVESPFAKVAEFFDFGSGGGRAVEDDFDGEFASTYGRNEFRFVDDDDHFGAGAREDFFSDEGAAAAFNHPFFGVDFISSVNGDVDAGDRVDVEYFYAALFGEIGGGARAGNGFDPKPFFGGVNEGANEAFGCRARAESDNHSTFNPFYGFSAGSYFCIL